MSCPIWPLCCDQRLEQPRPIADDGDEDDGDFDAFAFETAALEVARTVQVQ